MFNLYYLNNTFSLTYLLLNLTVKGKYYLFKIQEIVLHDIAYYSKE